MTMSVTAPDEPLALATFRATDADRLLATAIQHRDGWTLSMPGCGGSVQTMTFEGCVCALLARTGVHRLVIVWLPEGEG